jgi:predicted RND superfamily exporter protein
MGWAGLPLDMATVMIASVSLGIGVDCAIHYLFRLREELEGGAELRQALLSSHGSIGTSILYTSLTSVVGFSVLYFSAFRPNAYFGVLTGLAMVAALFAMLTLLPVLVTFYNPFRPSSGPQPNGST